MHHIASQSLKVAQMLGCKLWCSDVKGLQISLKQTFEPKKQNHDDQMSVESISMLKSGSGIHSFHCHHLLVISFEVFWMLCAPTKGHQSAAFFKVTFFWTRSVPSLAWKPNWHVLFSHAMVFRDRFALIWYDLASMFVRTKKPMACAQTKILLATCTCFVFFLATGYLLMISVECKQHHRNAPASLVSSNQLESKSWCCMLLALETPVSSKILSN